MNRRHFALSLTFGPFAAPFATAQQQTGSVRHVSALLPLADDELGRSRLGRFQQKLEELGASIHQNIIVDARWAGDDAEVIQRFAAELIAAEPDALFAVGTSAVGALVQRTRTIPIVFVQVTDPVAAGFVADLSSPGGNVTGFANFGASVGGERVRLLNEVAPHVRRAMIIFEAEYPLQAGLLRSSTAAASSLGIRITEEGVRDFSKLEKDVAGFAQEPNGGLVIVQGPFTTRYRKQIVALAELHRLPAVYPLASFTEAGGLVSHGVNLTIMWQAAAEYVSRILLGVRPGDLAVQEPRVAEVVLNLGTARKLGLAISPSVRGHATKLID